MEADCLGAAFQYCTFEVVIEDDPGNGAPGGERLDVAAQEVVHSAVQVKSQEQVREYDSTITKPSAAGRLADADRTEVRPVALRLFAGEGAQT